LRTIVLAVSLYLAMAAQAAAASFVVGTGSSPNVAVDPAGTAYIAWASATAPNPAQYCRLPRGAAACDVTLTLPSPPGASGSGSRPVVQVSGSRVSVLHYSYGQTNQITLYQSTDGGVTFSSRQVGGNVPIYDGVYGPGDEIGVVTTAVTAGGLFQTVPLTGGAAARFATFPRQYSGAVGLDGTTRVIVFSDAASNAAFRRYVAGDPNDEASWSPEVEIGYADYTRLAGGVNGLFMLTGNGARGIVARRFDGAGFTAPIAVGPGFSPDAGLSQDAAGRLHAVYPMLDAAGYHAMHAVSDDGVAWRVGELEPDPSGQPGDMRVGAAADHVGVAVWRGAGSAIRVSAIGPDAPGPPPVIQPPPVFTPTPTPTPDPLPVFAKSVVVRPVSGVVRVRLKGSSKFVSLTSLDDVPLGATIDTRKGRIELRSVPKPGAAVELVQLYEGMFRVDQKRGITNFTLNEPLAKCGSRGRAAASKPKSRRLWGDGKGKFRTTGKYAAATVRGTKWLVRDSCAGTLTKVTSGAVNVSVKGKKRVIVVRAGRHYLARAKRR
jgi:hypothetical protein